MEPSKCGQNEEVLTLLREIQSLKLKDPYRGDQPTRIYGGERFPDFSQFKPRGHYTKNQPLRNYFRCMMWLGRVDCGWNVLPTVGWGEPHAGSPQVPPPGTPGVKADSDRELRDAILFCELLRETRQVQSLKALDDILGFLVGRSDNLSVFMLLDIMKKAGADTLAAALDAKKLEKMKDAIKNGKHAAQMIRSQFVISNPMDTYKVPPPSVFQVFGQRFIMDSFVLAQVVFDSIIFQNRKQRRMMPMGLDVMAALGNDEALLLLEPELKKWNYSANMLAAREFIGLHAPAYWKSNLYVLWLDCLRTLQKDMSGEKRFPQTMKTKAWQMKQLNTQLGSWAELRHDTILYAKQSYTAQAELRVPRGLRRAVPGVLREGEVLHRRGRQALRRG